MRNVRFKICSILLQLPAALLLLVPVFAKASQVDISQADTAARRWLKNSPQFGHTLPEIKSIEPAFSDKKEIYFVVNLSPAGFVILSPDERLEPVIAFSSEGRHVPDKESPLYKFAKLDISARLRCLKRNPAIQAENAAKWEKYLEPGLYSAGTDYDVQEEFDIRVEPLVQSIWGQQDEADLPCYNYYIPPGSEPDGDPNNNIRCGCVATAMAQVMRYHRHPSGPVGVSAFSISVSGNYYTAYTRGGDGAGGPYQWYNMPPDPNQFTNDIQRRAIGALCHDAGLTVNMSYSPSGSGAAMRKIHDALSNFFQYSCAVYGVGSFDSAGAKTDIIMELTMPMADINRMINPGLDAGYPSILGIDGPAAGHAVVVDGYCYQDETLYHHLNMGWYGRDNVWYALPDVNSMPSYDVIDACIYNIFPDGTGEIVSGRVFDAAGVPVENATVLALRDDVVVQQDTTNEKGMYALAHLPSEQTYVLRAEKENCRFPQEIVYLGTSNSQGQPHTDVTGNVWGVDFHHPSDLPPAAMEPSEPNVVDSNSVMIVLKAMDEGLPNPPGRIIYIIETLPQHGRLYDPNFGEVVDVPYQLRNDANSVIYEPCRYFFGLDSFAFKANDGGVSPSGGDSNIAEIWLNVVESEIGSADYFSDYPLHTWKQDSRTQLIYTAAELGREKLIGAISLNILQPPSNLLSHLCLRMQHTPLAEYQVDRDFLNTGWTTVYEADTLILTSGWRRFDFQTPFDYNGRDNLLLDISFDNACWAVSNGLVYGLYAANQDMSQSSDSQHGDPRFWTVSIFGGYLSENIKPSLKIHTYISDVLTADFNTDCRVSLPDLLSLMEAWLTHAGTADYDGRCDVAVPMDYAINSRDFCVLACEWLAVYE